MQLPSVYSLAFLYQGAHCDIVAELQGVALCREQQSQPSAAHSDAVYCFVGKAYPHCSIKLVNQLGTNVCPLYTRACMYSLVCLARR